MIRFLVLIFCVGLLPHHASSQHTFSIVAVDSTNREIGSAGATCGDSIIWPGTPGAQNISEILPGIGAIHTQASYIPGNQNIARQRMVMGDSPEEIIRWVTLNDVGNDSTVRQYGVVDYNSGSPRSAAFTGDNAMDYKNHIVGPGYAIQGNILLGQHVLDSMEARFLRTDGCLVEKLMAAMQGAKMVGADTRCTSEGTSSLSAFLRLAKPNDQAGQFFIDINVAGTPDSVEPIDVLQQRFTDWKIQNSFHCLPIIGGTTESSAHENLLIYPNPADQECFIQWMGKPFNRLEIFEMTSQVLREEYQFNETEYTRINTQEWDPGIYLAVIYKGDLPVASKRITVIH